MLKLQTQTVYETGLQKHHPQSVAKTTLSLPANTSSVTLVKEVCDL